MHCYTLPGFGSILPWLGTSSTKSTASSVSVSAATELPPGSRAWTPSAPGCLLTLPGAGHTGIVLQQLLAEEKRGNFYPPPG